MVKTLALWWENFFKFQKKYMLYCSSVLFMGIIYCNVHVVSYRNNVIMFWMLTFPTAEYIGLYSFFK